MPSTFSQPWSSSVTLAGLRSYVSEGTGSSGPVGRAVGSAGAGSADRPDEYLIRTRASFGPKQNRIPTNSSGLWNPSFSRASVVISPVGPLIRVTLPSQRVPGMGGSTLRALNGMAISAVHPLGCWVIFACQSGFHDVSNDPGLAAHSSNCVPSVLTATCPYGPGRRAGRMNTSRALSR